MHSVYKNRTALISLDDLDEGHLISRAKFLKTEMKKEEVASATRIDQHIIELHFLREDVILTKEEVAFGWELARELDPQKKSGVLLKTGKWTLIDKTAREYVTSEFKEWGAVAVLVHNPGQRLMGKIIASIAGLSGKVNIFENETNALKWLKDKF